MKHHKTRDPQEPGGARRSHEEPGESQEEPGQARRSHEQPGGSQEEPGGAKRGQEEPGGARIALLSPWFFLAPRDSPWLSFAGRHMFRLDDFKQKLQKVPEQKVGMIFFKMATIRKKTSNMHKTCFMMMLNMVAIKTHEKTR